MVVQDGSADYELTPPHDVLDQRVRSPAQRSGVRVYKRYDEGKL